MINVTKTFFPPIKDFAKQIERIWANQWLTNRGELTLELEERLKEYLNIDNIIIMNNGTIPIQIALKLLANNGEVITTPFSYVATTASILWENCTPVFVDIHPEFLTIDENLIEEAINENTTCILATHVFGNACNIEAIDKIAKTYNLKVIYDAAHCFGVNFNGQSIFKYGDVSTCSFHATKLFHTGEGGAAFCNNKELKHKIYYSHNFGHNGPLDFHGLGINGKISELQSAMGLSVLPHMRQIIKSRENAVKYYENTLNFINFRAMKLREGVTWNYSYYPIIFESEQILLKVQTELNQINIYPRRYFYPSLNNVPFFNGNKMPVSESIASRILCLPLYHSLTDCEINLITLVINKYE
jgi:dTDP-4-amino-4,6-dideoxygalactose transaminase